MKIQKIFFFLLSVMIINNSFAYVSFYGNKKSGRCQMWNCGSNHDTDLGTITVHEQPNHNPPLTAGQVCANLATTANCYNSHFEYDVFIEPTKNIDSVIDPNGTVHTGEDAVNVLKGVIDFFDPVPESK